MVPGGSCLAHLTTEQKVLFLSNLSAGSDLELQGTHFSTDLLIELRNAVRDPASGRCSFGNVNFTEATFRELADFGTDHFTGEAVFDFARFAAESRFYDATFEELASFEGTQFHGRASFGRAEFRDDAWFAKAFFASGIGIGNATFAKEAFFHEVLITGSAYFLGSSFSGTTGFDGMQVTEGLDLSSCSFSHSEQFGPVICGDTINLSATSFDIPIVIELAAARIEFQRARWNSKVTIRVRYAEVDISEAFFEYPVAIAGRPKPFEDDTGDTVDEGLLHGRGVTPRLLSVRGIDAAHLLLTNVDLSSCQFYGAFNLDHIQLEGSEFPYSPTGLRRSGLRILWWSRRRTLAEEHHWRATRSPALGSITNQGWQSAPSSSTEVLPPSALSLLYRQLRKALEDDKNEPDAADFYYGEMEARRHDVTRPRPERFLITAYWAFSGYGLRASRAFTWLILTAAVTVLSLCLWGIPKESIDGELSGHVTNGKISMTTEKPDPKNPDTPLLSRLNAQRLEKSFRVTANSVVFRSTGEELTTAGTYIEMASRLFEPIFLGLAVLAIRGRVKR
ncbi:hypothetical protein SUDANB66_02517 [Streptomyces sp. SudanB66_2053]